MMSFGSREPSVKTSADKRHGDLKRLCHWMGKYYLFGIISTLGYLKMPSENLFKQFDLESGTYGSVISSPEAIIPILEVSIAA